MVTRIVTAAAAIAVFILILLAPWTVFTIALAAAVLIMLHECYSAVKANIPMRIIGFVLGAAIMSAMYFGNGLGARLSLTAAAAAALTYVALIVFEHGKRSYKDIFACAFLTIYIAGSMFCIQLSRNIAGTAYMLLIFICAWGSDTFAYFSGRFFGKRKLIPNVSPNKTVAGAVGGALGAAFSCAVCVIVSDGFLVEKIIFGAIVGMIGGALSQLGDLAASAIKRDEDIKDFGKIFPGHGGFMDRFDSVVFIAPVIFLLIALW